jgi:hypothetical protein
MPKAKSRKMKPYAWTPDGKTPWKKDGGASGEDAVGLSYKRNKKLRKEAQRLNQIENKRARKYYKNQLKKELKDM